MVDLRKELCFKWETDVSKSQGVKVNYDLQTAWSMQPECYQTDCNQILYFSTHWIIKEDEELRMTHFLLINCFRQFAAASLLLRDKRERDWHYSQMLEADNVSDTIQIWREVLSWCVRSKKSENTAFLLQALMTLMAVMDLLALNHQIHQIHIWKCRIRKVHSV